MIRAIMGHLVDKHQDGHVTHCFNCECDWAKNQYSDCMPENQEIISDGRAFLLALLNRWDPKLGHTKSRQ
jgi:hypothetical protein